MLFMKKKYLGEIVKKNICFLFFSFAIFIFCSFFTLSKAYACFFGPCPNSATSPISITNTVENTMTKIAAVQQDLMLAEEFYQYMKSFAYMKASPGLFGAVSYIGNMTSAMSSMGQQGLTGLQQTTNAFGINGMSPEQYQNVSGMLGLTASTAGSISSMSSTLSMLNTQNGGVGGLAMINGASLVTQAALTGAQASLNILNYYHNKDVMANMQMVMKSQEQLNEILAESPTSIPIPCRDMAPYQQGSTNANMNVPMSACETVSPGTPLNIQSGDFQNGTSQALTSAVQNYTMQQMSAAAAMGAPASMPNAPTTPPTIPTNMSPPGIFAGSAGTAVAP